MTDRIRIRGARVNNLKGVDADLPRQALTAVTGVSGSGKSSFAFDTVFRAGKRRYLSALSASARLLAGKLERPDVESISGLGAAVAVSQHQPAASARSTVGTATGLWDLVRMLFARLAEPKAQASLLSFNHETGACPECKGLGVVDAVDPDLIVADPSQTIRGGALVPTLKNGYTVYSQVTVDVMNDICAAHGFDVDTPWQDLTDAQREVIFYGTKALVVPFGKHSLESRLKWSGITAKPREEGYYRGLVPVIEETLKRNRNDNILRFVRSTPCEACEGTRLSPEARVLRLGDLGPSDFARATITELSARFEAAVAGRGGAEAAAAEALGAELATRSQVLLHLGLGHLPLMRATKTLSSGERQRIRLAQQLDDDLAGLTYVLDEPSVDLHPSARHHLQSILHRLVAAGSTVVTVEHDPELMRRADHIVELGPGPGRDGGEILFSGPPAELEGRPTATGRALAAAPATATDRGELGPRLWVRGARRRNLVGDDVPFVLGALNVVAGVSGAGKSTLVTDVLASAMQDRLQGRPGRSTARLDGADELEAVIVLDAKPIGRTPRSNPATYTGLFDLIRKAFAKTEAAKAHGFSASRFSFNTAGGRCPSCEGAGVTRVGMHGLGDVSVRCATCQGQRFDPETLEVTVEGLSIAEVLDLEVRQARVVFAEHPKLTPILEALEAVGLGYLGLGQPATDLSGGEAQRVRLATELAKRTAGPTLYLLDEPTRGLHPEDLAPLLETFGRLTARGHTLVVVEHNPTLWRAADWLVELGPGAGEDGGRLCFAGLPADRVEAKDSATAAILRGERPAESGARGEEVDAISLRGVRTHNLQSVDATFPYRALTVVTGPSGSGKTSLCFDTLAAEAGYRLMSRLGTHVRRRLRQLPRPTLDSAGGLTPTFALSQRAGAAQPRSTVGTSTEVQDYLRLLFSRLGAPRGRPASDLSFNGEAGACPVCTGLGFSLEADPEALVTDPTRGVLEGACVGTAVGRRLADPDGQHAAVLRAAAARAGIDVSGPFEALSAEARHLVLRGDEGPELDVEWRFVRGKRTGTHALKTRWTGLLGVLETEYQNTHLGKGAKLESMMRRVTCRACDGRRLGPRALEVRVEGVDLGEIGARSVTEVKAWLRGLAFPEALDQAALEALEAALGPRLDALEALGLGHLHPNRGVDTLSGGERLRVTLAAQIGAPMTAATFVLDEPTRGLHARDVDRLLGAVRGLVDAGNTVVLVDHHPRARAHADHLVRLGPGAGPEGGRIEYAGPPEAAPAAHQAAGLRPPQVPDAPPIEVRGACAHNLRRIDVDIPGSGLTALVGPSGAGKSTLLSMLRAPPSPSLGAVHGLEAFAHVRWLDASPLAGGWNSVVATAVGAFDGLRNHFAAQPEAKAAGLGKSSFAFSSAAGRCPACKGTGRVEVALDFLPDASAPCEVCEGRRYRPEVLACAVGGLSIADALALTVTEAARRFADAKFAPTLNALVDLDLGHLSLGRAAPTLSGGEAQRVRLAALLAAPSADRELILLDEPSRGLDAEAVLRVQSALHRLAASGHAVVIVTHDALLEAGSHHVVELGPGGGPDGGRVVRAGPPEIAA